jgi:hypothetical protein
MIREYEGKLRERMKMAKFAEKIRKKKRVGDVGGGLWMSF